MASRKAKRKPVTTGLVILAVMFILCALCGLVLPDDDQDQKRTQAKASPSPTPSKVEYTADYAASLGCTNFTTGYRSATTAKGRTALVGEVVRWTNDSNTSGIRDAGAALSKSAKAGGKAWKTSASKFTKLCKARGWVDYSPPSGDKSKDRKSTDGSNGGSSDGGGWPGKRGGRGWW